MSVWNSIRFGLKVEECHTLWGLRNHCVYTNSMEIFMCYLQRCLIEHRWSCCSSKGTPKILLLFCRLRTRQYLRLVWTCFCFLHPPPPSIVLNDLDVTYGFIERSFNLCKMCALVLAQARRLKPMDLLFLEKAAVYHLLPHLSLLSLPFQSIPLKAFGRKQFCVSRKWIICFFQRKGPFFFFPVKKPQVINTEKAVLLFDTLGGPHVKSSFTEHICGCIFFLL